LTRLRAATVEDAPAIQALYAHYVLHSAATFEEVPPTAQDMAQRIRSVIHHGLPWLALEDESGLLIGYAYAAPYKTRSAYRYCVEDSVYLREDCRGQGHGGALLGALITACEARGLTRMLGVISASQQASIRLHERFGFTPAGLMTSVGYKFGQWQSVAILERILGAGDSAAPSAKGGIFFQ
jgi:L-amino acid N-acyltransferase YncA